MPSACGTRTSSACAPCSPPNTPPTTHEVCTPARQWAQRPHDHVNGATTTCPTRDVADVRADLLDHADVLVADAVGLADLVLAAVGPQVGAADAGGEDAHQGLVRLLEHGVREGLGADVAGGVDDGGAHPPTVRQAAPARAGRGALAFPTVRVLVVGAGAREHALVRSFLAEDDVDAVVAGPGNPGMAAEGADCRHVDLPT